MGKLFWIVVIFLLVGAYIIKTGLDTDFDKPQETKNFVVRFGQWVMQLGGNVAELTGKAIEQDWLPTVNETEESTFFVIEE